MSVTTILYRFLLRGGTAAAVAALNEVPKARELEIETDTRRGKLGDGATAYNSLPYCLWGDLDFAALADGYVVAWNAAGSTFEMVPGSGGSGAMIYLGQATVTGAAASTLAISGLDLDADGRYYIEFGLKNATASAAQIDLFYNADTTATNYDSQVLGGIGTSASAGRGNNGRITDLLASSCSQGDMTVSKDLDGKPSTVSASRLGSTTAIRVIMASHLWRTAGTNVTGLTLSSSVANSLAVGSYVKVWQVAG